MTYAKLIEVNRSKMNKGKGNTKLSKVNKKLEAYWKFMFSKALRTGLQSSIGIYLSANAGIIDELNAGNY